MIKKNNYFKQPTSDESRFPKSLRSTGKAFIAYYMEFKLNRQYALIRYVNIN